MDINLEDHQYPIGPFIAPTHFPSELIQDRVDVIESLPLRLRASVSSLSEPQLDTPYREGGWTIRQVVHHIPDSHVNSYVRFKLALTEEKPTIRPYLENLWAELPEARTGSIEMSLDFLSALHIRWVAMLRALTDRDLQKEFIHPESGSLITLAENICSYAWHGDHHLAQIESLKIRNSWN